MDELEKTYNYEDDNEITGFVMLFACMLVFLELLFGVLVLVQTYRALKNPTLSGITLILGIAFLAYILFTCFALFKIRKFAVIITKIFLVLRVLLLVPACVVSYLNNENSIAGRVLSRAGNGPDISILVIPLLYIFLFSIPWFLYFMKSERVRKTYGT